MIPATVGTCPHHRSKIRQAKQIPNPSFVGQTRDVTAAGLLRADSRGPEYAASPRLLESSSNATAKAGPGDPNALILSRWSESLLANVRNMNCVRPKTRKQYQASVYSRGQRWYRSTSSANYIRWQHMKFRHSQIADLMSRSSATTVSGRPCWGFPPCSTQKLGYLRISGDPTKNSRASCVRRRRYEVWGLSRGAPPLDAVVILPTAE